MELIGEAVFIGFLVFVAIVLSVLAVAEEE